MAEQSDNSNKNNQPLSGATILIVEDDSFLLGLVMEKFKSDGCRAIFAADGGKALALAEKEKPNLILLDLLLPGMNGFDVLSKLKENPALKDIPVVVFTNLSDESSKDRAKSLGVSDYVVKSNVTLEEVLDLINKKVGHKK